MVKVALLSPAEPASQEAMGLLCHITSNLYGEFMEKTAMENLGYHAARRPYDPGELDGSAACAKLARMGAANAGLAHLKHLSRPGARRNRCGRGRGPEDPRVMRGDISKFVCWICEAPRVFREMRERGLLEALVDMLRSRDGDERTDAVHAVGVLAMRHEAAREPLRALGAIRPLVAKLQVCQGM